MYQPKTTQDRISHRLKISLGHLKKVIAMVESGDYCIDVLHQSKALQEALAQTDNLILKNHLATCVAGDIKSGKGDKAISEVMSVFEKRKR